MMRQFVAAAFLLALVGRAMADSIDDAEAKRRGVPVAQVVAERQLAAEKVKTAGLEKQLAGLQKQLADLQAGNPAAAPATTPAAPAPVAAAHPPATPARGGTTPARGTVTVTPTAGHTYTFSDQFDSNGVAHQIKPATATAPGQ